MNQTTTTPRPPAAAMGGAFRRATLLVLIVLALLVPMSSPLTSAALAQDDEDTEQIIVPSDGLAEETEDATEDDADENTDTEEQDIPRRSGRIERTLPVLDPRHWAGVFDSRLLEGIDLGNRPARLRVEAAGIDATISVKEIVNGEMQTPKDEYDVAWYKETGKPGERANMVLAGHLNWYGVPEAVFFHLDKLEKNDEIVVTDEAGKQFRYKVTWVKLLDADEEGVAKAVKETTKPALTLITCGGEWDRAAAVYNQRTVVRAELVTG